MKGDVPAWKRGRFGGLNSSWRTPVTARSGPLAVLRELERRECRRGARVRLRRSHVDRVAAADVVLAAQNWPFIDELTEELREIFAEIVVDQVELALLRR